MILAYFLILFGWGIEIYALSKMRGGFISVITLVVAVGFAGMGLAMIPYLNYGCCKCIGFEGPCFPEAALSLMLMAGSLNFIISIALVVLGVGYLLFENRNARQKAKLQKYS